MSKKDNYCRVLNLWLDSLEFNQASSVKELGVVKAILKGEKIDSELLVSDLRVFQKSGQLIGISQEKIGELNKLLDNSDCKMKTSPNHLKKIMLEVFNKQEYKLLDSITATTHEVYIVMVNEKKYAIRIATKDKPAFYTELWALKNSKRLNISAPELIAGDDSKKVIPFRFTVETFIEGYHVPSTEKGKLKIAYDKLSQTTLKKIHKNVTSGFGPLDEHGKGRYATWQDFLQAKFEKAYRELKKQGILPISTLRKIDNIHNTYIKEIQVQTPKIILGDLHPKNFFVQNSSFCFVDLKSIMGGDPLWEYGLINYYLDIEIWPSYVARTNSALRRYQYYLINITINKLWFHHQHKQDCTGPKEKLKRYLANFPDQ
ncbi:phosphotransferase [Candidatus Woesearchaeota archaeon]|nr:phosphotransferase [Candidatus Woesearchaeota archaeon]